MSSEDDQPEDTGLVLRSRPPSAQPHQVTRNRNEDQQGIRNRNEDQQGNRIRNDDQQGARNRNDDQQGTRNRNEDQQGARNRSEDSYTKQSGNGGNNPELPPSPKKSPSVATPTKSSSSSHPFLRLAVPRSAKVFLFAKFRWFRLLFLF